MSINTEVHVERKLLSREGNINDPPIKPSPFTNDFFPRLEFVNPSSITQAGMYEKTVKLPEPIRAWHSASKGATDDFKGCLIEIFPELKDLSEKELEEIKEMRDKV